MKFIKTIENKSYKCNNCKYTLCSGVKIKNIFICTDCIYDMVELLPDEYKQELINELVK